MCRVDLKLLLEMETSAVAVGKQMYGNDVNLYFSLELNLPAILRLTRAFQKASVGGFVDQALQKCTNSINKALSKMSKSVGPRSVRPSEFAKNTYILENLVGQCGQ